MLYKLITIASIFALTAKAEEDGEFYSDDESAEMDGGLGVSLLQEEGEPLVLFYRGNDRAKRVYCFRFAGSYEANGYESPGDGSEIDGSSVDFGDDVDWSYQGSGVSGEDAFAFRIFSMGHDKWDEMNLTFSEMAMEDGYTALHFDIAIRGYVWHESADENSVFVMQVDLDDCSDAYSQERASQSVESEDDEDSGDNDDEDDGEDDEDDEDDEADSEEADVRRLINVVKAKRALSRKTDIKQSRIVNLRRLLDEDDDEGSVDADEGSNEDEDDDEDSDSADESEGVSSDDSNEFDLEAAIFEIEDTATGDMGEVNVTLHYESSNDALEMVFGYFGENLDMDPTLAMDSDKVDEESNSGAFSLLSAPLVSLAMTLAAFIALAL